MPAPRVVLRRDRIADAARDFHPEQQGEQHVRTGGVMPFRQGQDGWCHRRGRMDHRREVRVIVIEQVGTDRIEGRGTERIQACSPPDHRGFARPGEGLKHCSQGREVRVARGADRTPEEIHQRPLRVVLDRRREIVPLHGADEVP